MIHIKMFSVYTLIKKTVLFENNDYNLLLKLIKKSINQTCYMYVYEYIINLTIVIYLCF